jgi:hypothetical protein
MNDNKEQLNKLLKLVVEISNQPGNDWFKNELIPKNVTEIESNFSSNQMSEIYEHCLRKIIKEHAEHFYSDFKLLEIKNKLIEDFIRMEKFRREDNFEDFCLALFQQIEGVVNELATEDIQEKFISSQNKQTHNSKNKSTGQYESQKLWQLIFYPGLDNEALNKKTKKGISDWDFLERYKAILYFHYYKEKIHNIHDFNIIFFLGSDLYQSRNLNHRGGRTSDNQKKAIDKVTANSHRYYFKFLGFLEDFMTKINLNI